jgi:hypothetical protein
MHRLAAMSYRTITSYSARAALSSPLPSPRTLLSPRTAQPALTYIPRRASIVRMASSSSRDIDADHERLAQQEYKKSYTALDEHQRRHVGGKMAVETRARKAGQSSGKGAWVLLYWCSHWQLRVAATQAESTSAWACMRQS